MNFKIEPTNRFKRESKKLMKKYPSLKDEFFLLRELLIANPKTGTSIGKDCYKIRISIASKNTGKSGGARIITHVQVTETTVYLLSIYDKGEQENLKESEINKILKEL